MSAKSIKKYKPVMGVVHRGEPVTDCVRVLRILAAKRDAEIVSWPRGKVLFYFDRETGDVVYPNDITYSYVLNDEPVTALELIKKARANGFNSNNTKGASAYLSGRGFRVKNNPNPTYKFTGIENR